MIADAFFRAGKSARSLMVFLSIGLLAACTAAPGDTPYKMSRNAAEIDQRADDRYAMDDIMAGDFAAAERKLLDGSRFDADDPYRLLNLALVYQKTDRAEMAVDIYRRVLELNANPRAALASGFGRPVKDIAKTALTALAPDGSQ